MNKRNFAMNKIKAIALGVFIFALFACEQPFKAGLGPVVDIRPPTVTLTSPFAGGYISGEVLFEGTAEDDYILSKVEIMVTNHPNINHLRDGWTEVDLRKSRQNEGTWSYRLYTQNLYPAVINGEPGLASFPDGDLKIRIKVTDSVNKTSELDEMVFNVKNKKPAISVTSPSVMEGNLPGNVGGQHLNYYTGDPTVLPNYISYPRRVDKDSSLIGSIADAQGIYPGPLSGKKFPPQIRIWRVDGTEDRGAKIFKPGSLPSDTEVPWESFRMNGADANLIPLQISNEGNMTYGQFSYRLSDIPGLDSGQFYGFQIRAQSVDQDGTEFHYPPADNPPPSDPQNWYKMENSYVLFYITARQSPPTVALLNLENIFDLGAWDDDAKRYRSMDVAEPYPWIDKTTVNNRNGAFTLRVRATHTQGIDNAEVYWTKEGTSDRGRFIWDLANETPQTAGGEAVAGWEAVYNVPARHHYSQWGYADPNSKNGSIYARRNFIFTYNDDNDKVPSAVEVPGIHDQVAGKPKIQRYKGNDWDQRITGNWSQELVFDENKWEGYPLTEGVYRIEVWARSSELTGMAQAFECSIRIDKTKPEVVFTSFNGAYGEAMEKDIPLFPKGLDEETGKPILDLQQGDLIVNGVIQPILRFSDTQEADSGLRTGTDAYFKDENDRNGPEQLFILVKDGDHVQMDRVIANEKNWWPDLASLNDTLPLPGTGGTVTAIKHGPVRNSRFLLKTSAIYDGTPAETGLLKGTLDDGAYHLYVFARDNAFNVGSASRKIMVKKASDDPRFDFSLTQVDDKVKNPNPIFDSPASTTGQGFWVANEPNARNLLGSSQSIKIGITDDDSLDLGVEGGSASKVEITFYGTKQDSAGTITEGVSIALGDEVKKLFAPQTMTGTTRNSVKDRSGTITQEFLLAPLKANANYNYLFTSETNAQAIADAKDKYTATLPDGVYKLVIKIADYPPAKLTMAETDPLAVAVTKDATVWFVVDSMPPAIVGALDPLTNSPDVAVLKDTGITGSVSDRNGPITISWTLEGGTPPLNPIRTGTAEMGAPNGKLSSGIWEAGFTAKVDLTGLAGTFTVTLNIRDRFGRIRSEQLRYSVDAERPKVNLMTRIATVDRSAYAADTAILTRNKLHTVSHTTNETNPALATPAGPNLARLANGVLRFIIAATDDTRVDQVRWWLVPAGTTFVGWEQSRTTGLWGEFTSNFSSTPHYIDTKALDISGKYSLYAMAKDGGGNYSVGSIRTGVYAAGDLPNPLLQTIYITEESDRPFFVENDNFAPANGATVDNTVLRGMIREDDGFSDSSGSILYRTGASPVSTVRIWMHTESTGLVDGKPTTAFEALLDADNPDFTTYGYTGPISINPDAVSVTAGRPNLDRQGADIVMNVNLATYFPAMFTKDGKNWDGPKYYIIEARDSSYGKYLASGTQVTDGTADPRVTRRLQYSFMYDTLPPRIDVSFPNAQDNSFTGDINNLTFRVTGWMQDVNLDQARNPATPLVMTEHYYFEYRLNSALGWEKFFLDGTLSTSPPETMNGERYVIPNYEGDETRVYFDISPARAQQILRSGDILSGNNTLLLAARDKTGKQTIYTIPFFTDSTGPNIELSLKEVKLDTLVASPAPGPSFWWTKPATIPTNEAWYMQRWDILKDKDVPVIQRGNDGSIKLEGTFRDESSNVGPTYRYGFDVYTNDPNNTTVLTKTGNTLFDSGASKDARWEVTASLSDLSDGLHSIQLIAYDEYNNATLSGMFAFRIVSGQPAVTLTMPASAVYGNKTDTFFKAEGTAESPNLENVNLIIRHGDLVKKTGYKPYTLTITNTRSISGTTATNLMEKIGWELDVTRAILLEAGKDPQNPSTTALTEGVYEVAVVSIDLLGVESEEEVGNFIVDTSSPTIKFTGLQQRPDGKKPYDSDLVGITTLSDKTLTSATPRIQATIEDKWSDIRSVQRQIRKYDYGTNTPATPTTEGWTYYNKSITSWVYQAAPPDGDAYWMDVEEAQGSQYGAMNWNLKDTFTGIGTVPGLTDGFYSIRVRAKDSSKIVADNANPWADTNGNPIVSSNYIYFFYATVNPQIQHSDSKETYSTRNEPVKLGIKVTDENRFNKLTVEVKKPDGTAVSPAITLTLTPANGNALVAGSELKDRIWEPSVTIPFVPGTHPDGSYSISFTVSDLAGRSSTEQRTITLDNTAPKGSIDEPREVKGIDLYPRASEIQIGGETVTLNGTANDPHNIQEIWFHLGYGFDNTARPSQGNSLTGNTNIANFPSEARVKGYFTNNGTPGVGFDTAGRAPHPSSAWFQYVEGAPPSVLGFENIPDITTLFSWSLEMKRTAIADYVKEMTVQGITYKAPGSATQSTNGPWMVQPVDEARIPEVYKRGDGLYSLPLWVRMVDGVGNVSYEARDIWIYPNGDYPYATISASSNYFTPIENSRNGAPRGGLISIEGVANDNLSVRKVIYRVKADSHTTPATWNTYDGGDGTIRTFSQDSAKLLTADSDATRIRAAFLSVDNGTRALGDSWYVATLETAAGGQSVPWSFNLNANNEFADLIRDYGFNSNNLNTNTDASLRNMIRVRVEMYVFDDNGESSYAYNKVSLGGSGNQPGSAEPYVLVFYIQNSAPKIPVKKISRMGSTMTDLKDYEPGQEIRNRRFAIQAELDGSGEIGQIQVRLQQESDANAAQRNWMTVYTSAGGSAPQSGMQLTLNAAKSVATLDWQFDSSSANAAAATGYKWIRGGDWASTGGRYAIDVRVTDTKPSPNTGEAMYTFIVDIDNFAPVADNRAISSTNPKVAGTNMSFTGRVFDYSGNTNNPSPPYRGIDRVLVWFTTNQNGTADYINMNTKMPAQAQNAIGGTSTMPARTGRTATVVGGTGNNVTSVTVPNANIGTLNETYTYPRPGDTGGSTDYLKVLSLYEAGTLTNQITWQQTTNHDVLWNFIADTTKMPDGRIYLNYLVVDHAGNATQYQQPLVVMNNYPQITNVTLRTDNMGVGAVFTTHEGDVAEEEYSIPETPFDTGYLNSGFISKNRFIAFGVDTIGGNGNLNYRVQYVERVQIPLNNANLRVMATAKPYPTAGITVTDVGGTSRIVNSTLYTIANKGNVDDDLWALLGTHTSRPPVGTNFVFQADLATVTGLTGYNGTVWGYRVVNTVTARTALNQTSRTITTTIPNANPDLAPSAGPLTFNTSTEFGATGIQENSSGGAFFLIKVWDSVTGATTEDDRLYDAVVVGMSVFLTDSTNPTARLYDLNPYTETAVINNNFDPADRTDTIKNAADPIAIGSNILRGGLFNIKTERDVLKSGYIDPRSGTTALQPQVQDPNNPSQWRTTRADGFVTGDSNNAAGSPNRDKVSGRVILRGLAHDDQFVKEIRIKIGDNTEKVILQLTDLDAAGNPTTVPASIVKREMRAASGVQAFAYEELHWKNGHTVEWAYVWDTETEPTNAGGRYRDNVSIAVSVIDRNGTGGGLPSISRADLTNEATTRVYHNTIPVDIVPYVVGFERASQYSTIRSRQGWYSFFQGEADIALLGYNLATATVAPAITYTTSTAVGTTMNAIAVNNVATRFPFPLRYTFTVPPGAVSGKINVTTTGATGVTPATRLSYNHESNHADKSWNRENGAYIAGSDLWNNKPHAHIWRTTNNNEAPRTYFGAGNTTSSNPTSPGLALEYASGTGNPGRLHAVWTSFGDATYYYGDSSGTRATLQTAPSGDPFGETDISLYNGTYTGTSQGSAPNVSVVYMNDGAPYVALRTTMTIPLGNDTNVTGTASTTTRHGADQEHRNARISVPVYTTTDANMPADDRRATERWRNTRIAKAAANAADNPQDPYSPSGDILSTNLNPGGTSFRAGRVYMTAYDSQGKYLWFGMRYNSGANNTYTNYTAIIDGVTGTAAVDRTTPIAATGVTASPNKGEFSAVDYDKTTTGDDRGPVIAYYDQANDTVRIACGTLGTGTYPAIANNAWTRRDLLPSTHALYKGSGKYISLKVDKNNGIHLAFYNSVQQTVVYAYMENRDTTAANVTAYTIDSVIQGGTWTDISVDDNGTPWIVYGNTSRMGNYDGVRVAYRSNSTGGTSNTGITFTDTAGSAVGWEAVSMPASYIIKNDRLNIEVWPPTNRAGGTLGTRPTGTENNWGAAIGYASDLYRIGYFYYPGYKGY
jgi:hypothetical protein